MLNVNYQIIRMDPIARKTRTLELTLTTVMRKIKKLSLAPKVQEEAPFFYLISGKGW